MTSLLFATFLALKKDISSGQRNSVPHPVGDSKFFSAADFMGKLSVLLLPLEHSTSSKDALM